jgi:hypothetical protein
MVTWWRTLFAARPGLQLAPDAIPAPWASGRRAIFDRIDACERLSDGSLSEPGFVLPDQQPHWFGATVAAGALDDGPGHTPTLRELRQAHDLCAALQAAALDHTEARLATLQQTLMQASGASIGATLGRLQRCGAEPLRLATLARWLACRAPDVIAVKCAIALLGQYGSPADADLIMTLGLHEEFTLTCALALCKLLGPEQSQTAMWNLARRVHGWGRIHVVRRLATTGCPEIQQWLLRDGYRNSRMDAYLAYPCATGGKLLPALQAGTADERLLSGAADILRALLHGRDSPAQQMHDYADGAAATLAFLECVARQRPRLPSVEAAVGALARIDEHALPWDEAHLTHVATLARRILAFGDGQAPGRDSLRARTNRINGGDVATSP